MDYSTNKKENSQWLSVLISQYKNFKYIPRDSTDLQKTTFLLKKVEMWLLLYCKYQLERTEKNKEKHSKCLQEDTPASYINHVFRVMAQSLQNPVTNPTAGDAIRDARYKLIKELSPTELRFILLLSCYKTSPYPATLAEDMGMTLNSVRATLVKLNKLGYISYTGIRNVVKSTVII